MRNENKTKLLIWAVILLALLNISTILTIYFGKDNKQMEEDSIVIDPESSPLSGRYLRSHLNFDSGQMEVYRNQSRKFRTTANIVIHNLNQYKQLLSKELNEEVPDMQQINNYSDSIGIAHAQLKKVTSQFYLDLRQICNQQQCEGLREIFSPLFMDNPHMQGQGRGAGRGRRSNGSM
ncbi:MAG: hypothetical protein EOM61_10920 [Bacteroidia bacterium]|nr:hypothetical protein [Bacteroidia bacterium]